MLGVARKAAFYSYCEGNPLYNCCKHVSETNYLEIERAHSLTIRARRNTRDSLPLSPTMWARHTRTCLHTLTHAVRALIRCSRVLFSFQHEARESEQKNTHTKAPRRCHHPAHKTTIEEYQKTTIEQGQGRNNRMHPRLNRRHHEDSDSSASSAVTHQAPPGLNSDLGTEPRNRMRRTSRMPMAPQPRFMTLMDTDLPGRKVSSAL